ncbi:MAG: S-adenosyl-l-methionine hydroxide adenosyltransferase family protein [Peptoniphilaceae bacterium]|nr:S-adenosyl-l-methionine hydroxide adenosyltransferase family protein [Peptoniphilaceae bacterium]MDD7433492.1 S-adenosyl-l-methionine hydroxide adenosyltransferase family protein [Peptoniphilaceae bacterium]MDY3076258.1 S-adenosyl-l-methionine hydroxide adenosyltransferase family protein [Peptoniphilaceae bacterium]MDY4196387.1 S-adenosyl-l-methionine hydroxide adenosyltransferase family protein [Peptoniphilaceae bacterium]MDY5842060.1 S-adenosyl-l-methionine hydroxide adenosyltransferase fa
MSKPLLFQSDFGLSDGAVAAMKGVAYGVDPDLSIFDLTHEIPQFDVWEGSYRLLQTVPYWPENTVFVSVVDPGVGTDRKSVVARTQGNQFIVTPDNGTLTHLKKHVGIVEIREIDENVNRLPNSGESYTFHGRDVYAYTGARLAAGVIGFEEVGHLLPVDNIQVLYNPDPTMENDCISGTIDVQDVRYGSLWSNISRSLFLKLGVKPGEAVRVSISNMRKTFYEHNVVYARSFAQVSIGEPLIYINSLDNVGLAINLGNFSRAYNIGKGTDWQMTLRKVEEK